MHHTESLKKEFRNTQCSPSLKLPFLQIPSDLINPFRNLSLQPIEPAAPNPAPPCGDPARKYLLHLLQRLPPGLSHRQKHMYERQPVERAKNKVHLPADFPEQARYRKCERAVPQPIARCGQADGFDANLGGKDLRRVRPGRGTPGHGEGADEKVAYRHDAPSDGRMIHDDPGDGVEGRVRTRVGTAVDGGEGAGDEEKDHHEKGADEEGRSAAPLVEEEDGGEGQGHVEDVLDRGCEKEVVDADGLHQVDHVVHHSVILSARWLGDRSFWTEKNAYTFIPESCDHIWIAIVSNTRFSMRGWVMILNVDCPTSRSKVRASSISRYCANTFGCAISPFPCKFARTRIDSSHRSWPASQRGEYGTKSMQTKSMVAGMIWIAHGSRNARVL